MSYLVSQRVKRELDAAIALYASSAGALNVGFQQEGAGASANNVQAKLREHISVKDFGAVGDGVTDDAAAISDALTAANGRELVFESGKTYLIGSAIVHEGDIFIRSDGAEKAVILHNGQSFDPLTVRGTLAVTTTLSLSQQINNRGWTLASIAGIQPGMLMEVISSASWYHDPRPGSTDARKSELHRVAYIPNASTVYSEDPANDGYNVSTETVTVKFYTPVSVRMENIAVKCVLPATGVGAANRTGVIVSYANEPVLLDVDVENAAAVGISVRGCYRPLVQRGHTHSANAFSTGYGVQIYGCAHSVVRDRTFWQCRRGVDVSGANVISRQTLIEACTNLGGGVNSEGTVYGWLEDGTTGAPQYGFGSHGPADHTIYRGNRVAQMHTPFNLRGRNEIIEDNYIIGRTRFGVIDLSFGENVWIRNNKVYGGWSTLKDSTIHESGANINSRRADWFVRVNPEYQGGEIVIEGNDVQIQDRFLTFDSGAVKPNVTIARNKIRCATSTSSDPVYLAYNEGATEPVSNWVLAGNDLARSAGSGTVNRFLNLSFDAANKMRDDVYSGTYTPTLTNTTNIAASTPYKCQFMRVGDVVTVSGRVAIDPTATGAIKLLMTLPIAAPNLDLLHLAGTGNNSLSEMPLAISGDATNKVASFDGSVTSANNRFVYFTFTYLLA